MSTILPQELNCVGCYKIPEEQIFQCITNHIFCGSCASSVHFCPKCVFQIGEIRNLQVTPVDREFYCPFKSKGCDEVIPQKDIKCHLQICQYGGEDLKICNFLGYKCEMLINTRNSSQILQHLDQHHNIFSNTAKFLDVELLDISKLDQHRNVAWSPILIDTEDQQLIVSAYLINGAISFTCFSLKEITNKFLVEFELVAESDEVSNIKWIVRPIPIVKAESVLQIPKLTNSIDILQKYYLFDGSLQLKIWIHGERFPVTTNIRDKVKIKLPIIHENAVKTHVYNVRWKVEENNNNEVNDAAEFSLCNKELNSQTINYIKEKNTQKNNNAFISAQTQNKFIGLKKADWFPCFISAGLGCALTLATMAALKIKNR